MNIVELARSYYKKEENTPNNQNTTTNLAGTEKKRHHEKYRKEVKCCRTIEAPNPIRLNPTSIESSKEAILTVRKKENTHKIDRRI